MFKAILDENNIYFGMEEVADLKDGDVEVPENCDLPNGRYRYDRNKKSFVPLEKSKRTTTPNAPLADKALYELLKITPNPPEYCVKWMKWFETTLDAKG